jgi:hypothetical protein
VCGAPPGEDDVPPSSRSFHDRASLEEVVRHVASPVEVLPGDDGSACANVVERREVLCVERRKGELSGAIAEL